jgi:hypothetical protein
MTTIGRRIVSQVLALNQCFLLLALMQFSAIIPVIAGNGIRQGPSLVGSIVEIVKGCAWESGCTEV